jgi:hypothetical protein
MRGEDRARAVRRRLVVEQNVAAAVDLNVDEAGREPGVLAEFAQRNDRRQFGTLA